MYMVQLMPLPLTVSCLSKIHIGFTFLIPAHPGSPGQGVIIVVTISYVLITAIISFRLLNARFRHSCLVKVIKMRRDFLKILR